MAVVETASYITHVPALNRIRKLIYVDVGIAISLFNENLFLRQKGSNVPMRDGVRLAVDIYSVDLIFDRRFII